MNSFKILQKYKYFHETQVKLPKCIEYLICLDLQPPP